MTNDLVPTEGDLSDALSRKAIPPIAWHVVSLRLGHLTRKPVPSTAIAAHYGTDVGTIRRMTAATVAAVRRSRGV